MRGVVIFALVIGVAVGAVVWGQHSSSGAAAGTHGPPLSRASSYGPAAGMGEAKTPLGQPAPAPAGSGGFRFLHNQRADPSQPVAWDPCRQIHYVVAGQAPAGAEEFVTWAVGRMSAATGLHFVNDGAAHEPSTKGYRPPYLPAEYGKRWAPLLLSWTDPDHVPGLKGDVIGLGGGSPVGTSGGWMTYVSGQVYLDTPQISEALNRSEGVARAVLRGVVLHELGHALGLNHVNDPSQIMNPEAQLQTTDLGAGDLRGLNKLGTGKCAPEL
jgi:hypothetical protein